MRLSISKLVVTITNKGLLARSTLCMPLLMQLLVMRFDPCTDEHILISFPFHQGNAALDFMLYFLLELEVFTHKLPPHAPPDNCAHLHHIELMPHVDRCNAPNGRGPCMPHNVGSFCLTHCIIIGM